MLDVLITYNIHITWICLHYVVCMLDVCYMFEQHITCFNRFVQGRLKHVMLYGYMFLMSYLK